MRTVQMEYLRPEEMIAERERCSIVYLPIGLLEWHGPHMPYGTDALIAQNLARRAAEIIGGVVMPTVYFGTERERPAYILEAKGFENPEEMYVWGMDIPQNSMKSFYVREEIFAITIREHLRLLVQQKYKLIVLINGHWSTGQKESLERLAIEFSNETGSRVILCRAHTEPLPKEEAIEFGHGTLYETALMRYLNDEHVDLSALPAREILLKYTDWGIADGRVFRGERVPGDAVIYDPRDATPERGKLYFDMELAGICKQVMEAYEKIK